MLSFNLMTSKELYLKIQSHWGLGLEHMNFVGTQFKPQHWGLGDWAGVVGKDGSECSSPLCHSHK